MEFPAVMFIIGKLNHQDPHRDPERLYPEDTTGCYRGPSTKGEHHVEENNAASDE